MKVYKVYFYINLFLKTIVSIIFLPQVFGSLIEGIFQHFFDQFGISFFFYNFNVPAGIIFTLVIAGFILWYFIIFCETINETTIIETRRKNYLKFRNTYIINLIAELILAYVFFNQVIISFREEFFGEGFYSFLFNFITFIIISLMGLTYFLLKRAKILELELKVEPKIFYYINLLFKTIVSIIFLSQYLGQLIDQLFLHFFDQVGIGFFFYNLQIPAGIMDILIIAGFILWFFIILCERRNGTTFIETSHKNYLKFRNIYIINLLAELFLIYVFLNLTIFTENPEPFNFWLFYFIACIIISITGIIYFSLKRVILLEKGLKIKTIPVSPKDLIELKRGFDYVGGLIRYKVAINNSTETTISNLDLSLKLYASHIRIVNVKPKIYKSGDKAVVQSMPPRQSFSVDFYLEPMICGSISVGIIASYLDAWGKLQTITREPINVDSKCPLIMKPDDVNIAQIENIYYSQNIIKSYKSFELKHDPRESFYLLIDAIEEWTGKIVTEPIIEEESPFKAKAYFYVLNQNPNPAFGRQEQIIILVEVDETKNINILNVGAEENPTVHGVLNWIWDLARKKFIEKFGFALKSIRCPECNAPIHDIDKLREVVICTHCGEEFEKKELERTIV